MPNHFETVVVVKGLIVNNGKALFVKRSNNAQAGGGTWELAGGKIKFGEDLETALFREIKEEVGLEVNVKKILYASSIQETARQIIILTYICESKERKIYLSQEHIDYRWLTKAEARQLMPENIKNAFDKNNVFSLEGWH